MADDTQAQSERGDSSRQGQSGEQYEPRMQRGTYTDRRYGSPGTYSFRNSNPNTITSQERYEQFDAQRRQDAGIGYPDPRMHQMQRDQGYPVPYDNPGHGYGNPRYAEPPPYFGMSSGYAGREHIDVDPVMFERFMRAAKDMGGDAARWFQENYRIVPRDEGRGRWPKGREEYDGQGRRIHRYQISLKA